MTETPSRGSSSEPFPTDPAGLPQAESTEIVDVADGDTLELRIAPVVKEIGEATVRMLAYNGSIPGPTLRVREGTEIAVDVVNDGDLETTVHWHGLRLENRFDGTHATQEPIGIGERFSYRLRFVDPGIYWYHPHVREDYAQELGLYGTILVVPADEEYWPPVDREVVLTLDDVLLEDGRVAPFTRFGPTHVAMGRYGNTMLVQGEPDLELGAQPGEVVRLYLTNTATTRVFDVGVDGARTKLVGGDSGRCEREELVERVLLAPSERAVVDVRFDDPGRVVLTHTTPARRYDLASVAVAGERLDSPAGRSFDALRTNSDMASQRERLAPYFRAEPDKVLAFVAEMEMGVPEGAFLYVCPMHPEVTSETPDVRCPRCGMKLVASVHGRDDAAPVHGTQGHEHGHEGHGDEASGGIEWEDDMVEVNRTTTQANTIWKLVDLTPGDGSGAVNQEIDWRFTVGDQVKLRLVNEMDSDHPMQHPFHVHGAGRFLVLCRGGVEEPNLVWKDTVLVRTGETVDILLEVTNPGDWMAHCHIAEHHESGMMLGFRVDPRPDSG